MAAQTGTGNASKKAAIRELLHGRTQIAEKLASQIDKYAAAKDAVTVAEQVAVDEAAKARTVYQEAIDAGWTATELTNAGLKPPAPPRKRHPDSGGGAQLRSVPRASESRG